MTYLTKESAARLNGHAMLPGSGDLCFRVHYWGFEPRLSYNPVHRHSFFEVCHVLDGEGTYMEEGERYPLRPGTFICSRPGATHQLLSDGGLRLLYVAYEVDEGRSSRHEAERYGAMALHARAIVPDGDASCAVALWKSLLIPEKTCWAAGPGLLPGLAHALLVSFHGLFMDGTAPIGSEPPRASVTLQRAKAYIRDNLDKELSLKQIARYLNVSERHLSRLFTSNIKESFVQYVRRERVRQAAYLLRTTDLPIKEIAGLTGFSSVHYMTRVFTAEMQVSPGRFRSLSNASDKRYFAETRPF